MEAVNLSQVRQTSFANKQEVQKETSKAPEQKKNGKKLLAAGAAAVATIAIAAVAIKKGKLPKATQVADLKFNKGIAIKGDELFTGVAEHTNKKGDKFLLEYSDGVLKKSMKNINPETGAGSLEKGNFIKTYSKSDGKLYVSRTEDTINGVQKSNCKISKNSVVRTDSSGKLATSDFKNGKIKEQILPDGTAREWYENGQIKSEKLPDGTETKWHINGQIDMKKLPDGTRYSWYENGQICFEEKEVALDDFIQPLKLKISYDSDGQVSAIEDVEFSKRVLVRRDNGEFYSLTEYIRGESIENILKKLNIEIPDSKYHPYF